MCNLLADLPSSEVSVNSYDHPPDEIGQTSEAGQNTSRRERPKLSSPPALRPQLHQHRPIALGMPRRPGSSVADQFVHKA